MAQIQAQDLPCGPKKAKNVPIPGPGLSKLPKKATMVQIQTTLAGRFRLKIGQKWPKSRPGPPKWPKKGEKWRKSWPRTAKSAKNKPKSVRMG